MPLNFNIEAKNILLLGFKHKKIKNGDKSSWCKAHSNQRLYILFNEPLSVCDIINHIYFHMLIGLVMLVMLKC